MLLLSSVPRLLLPSPPTVRFWQTDALLDPQILVDLLFLAALLAIAAFIIRAIPPLRRLAVPTPILAGLLGLALGPSCADLLPIDTSSMEVVVYHAFALMFIAGGLQSAPKTQRRGSALSFAVGNATLGVLQAMLGLLFVFAWLAIEPLHPGLGLMIMLGFQQGPGQALSLGGAWESLGMTDGAQIGLVFATLGFMVCIVLGIPLVAYARRRGLLTPGEQIDPSTLDPARANDPSRWRALPAQLLWILLIYAAVYAFIAAQVPLLPPKLAATAWGVHFIFGSLFAILLRSQAKRRRRDESFDDAWLAKVSVVTVNVTTAGAISAVRLEVLTTFLIPILLMTVLAGGLTLVVSMWLARRAFPEAPFSYALVLFGAGTGTVSTGLAMLRMLDPQLRGAVARNTVIGATVSVPFNAPMFMVVLPFAATQWSGSITMALWAPMGVLAIYLVALLLSWRFFTPLHVRRPLHSLWPPPPDDSR